MSGWNRHSNLVELLRLRAGQNGRRGYFYENESRDRLQTLTFAELDERARALAARFQEERLAGQPILLCYPAGLDFLVGLFACLYAGAIAVPTNVSRARRAGSRFAGIAADAGASLALTCSAWSQDLAGLSRETPALRGLRWLDSTKLNLDDAARWRQPDISPTGPAILQYTSGSTGNPKGVVLTHACLLHNLERMFDVLRLHEGLTVVCWLPAFHDMGLIGNLLQAVYAGGQMYLMAPVTFLREPLRWLEAIGEFGAYVSGAPNFAFDLCVQQAEKAEPEELARLDLSTWKVGYVGAEPISAVTLERFAKTFAANGFEAEAFFPCYGLAEATLMVSGGPGRTAPRSRRLLASGLEAHRVMPADNGAPTRHIIGCGRPLADMDVIIVDPATCLPCATGEIGEIWVAGPSVASGYWNRPEETADTFAAVRADLPERRYLRTGDLGFLDAGELFVTGRIKDLIIIRGRNLYPQDIEDTVRNEVTGLAGTSAAAFAISGPDTEKLVLVQEAARGQNPRDGDGFFRQVRQTIVEHFEVEVQSLVLIRAGTLPRSSSGKVRRRECQRRFLAGELDVVAKFARDNLTHSKGDSTNGTHKHHERNVETWLIDRLARHLKVPATEIDVRQPFAAYGLDSTAMVAVASDLEKWLGRRLSPTLLYDAPTIPALAHLLEKGEDRESRIEDRQASVLDSRSSMLTPAIAIVGMGCRFPGAESPEAFWQLLREGRHAIRELPHSRRQRRAKNPAANFAGFLDEVQRADLQFFGISPREGAWIDPQHRLLLEVAWEALEYGGISPHTLAGSNAGVFMGMATGDYGNMLLAAGQSADTYSGTGNARAMAANRLSYHLDLRGPSLTIDTACSSSLVAVHYACQSLRAGDCDLALAGGVNLILAPELSDALAQAQFLSPSGRCHAFDAAADGYVRGEGCGVVVLKLLSSAIRDRDMILAVIEGSAVNQDGKSNGITAPNGPSQADVIKRALKQAGRVPKDITFLETHGTGTALGDPIEFDALASVLGDRTGACYLGAVKANIGHLEAAAGMAGLIKIVLQLQYSEIVPLANFREPNPRLCLEGSRFCLPTKVEPWAGDLRVAGISSFGFGGTNAHLVVSDGVPSSGVAREHVSLLTIHQSQLLPLSARSPQALTELAARYRDMLDGPEPILRELCYSAAVGRAHWEHRLCIRAGSVAELQEALDRFLAGTPDGRTQVGSSQAQRSQAAGHGLPLLQPGAEGWNEVLDGIARQYVDGATIPWPELDRGVSPCRIVLPRYPFQRQRFWIDADETPEPLAGRSGSDQAPLVPRWLPRSHWGRDVPRRGLREAGDVDRLVEGLAGAVARLKATHNLQRFASLRQEFDLLTTRYLMETFSRLGWTPEAGSRANSEALAQSLRIIPRYQRLLSRLLAMAVEDNLLVPDGADFIVTCWPSFSPAADLHQELHARFPAFDTELTLAHRCASNMAAVMKGMCDPLHILFGAEMVKVTERLYEQSPVAGFYNELLAEAVAALVAAMPSNRPIRILELGAGTGGTTAHVAPRLPADRAELVFSDVSSVFLSRAQEKFAAYPFLQYRLLDLEKDLAEQGFADGQFDLIVAANVLHATRDIRRSLRQARRLLTKGGLLFLLESTQRHRLLDLIFGLTEGWWQFTDTDLRPDYPLLSSERWHQVLSAEGFEAALVPGATDDQSVLIGRARGAGEGEARQRVLVRNGVHHVNVVITANAERGRELARQLQDWTTMIAVDPTSDIGAVFDDLKARHPGAKAQVVYLDGDGSRRLADIVTLARKVAERGASLTVVTRGGLTATDDDCRILEDFGNLEFRWLDLDPEYTPKTQMAIAAQVLRHADRETVEVYRGDQRYVPRLNAGQAIDAPGAVALALPDFPGFVVLGAGAEHPFFGAVTPEAKATQESTSLDRQSLLALPAAERGKVLEEFLRSEFASITGVALMDADLDKPLQSFGLDSLMAIQLRNRVEGELKISLSLTDFLKGLSLSQIVANASQEMAGQTSEALKTSEVSDGSLGALNADNVENLSEGELDRFLQSLLKQNAEDVTSHDRKGVVGNPAP